MWEELADAPMFVLTGDQDWAPTWTVERELRTAAEVGSAVHLFATNDDPLVREPPPGLTLGIHPNFLPGSSHGDSAEAVVKHCRELVPGSTTCRTHGFAESTYWLAALGRHGIRADSNTCLMLQPGIVPLMHASGLLRFPVFLEDDVLMHWAGGVPPLDAVAEHLFTPGLKILNFHPAHVGINSRSVAHYQAVRRSLSDGAGEATFAHRERGIADLLHDVLAEIARRGHPMLSFPELQRRAERLVEARYPDGILGWRPGAPW